MGISALIKGRRKKKKPVAAASTGAADPSSSSSSSSSPAAAAAATTAAAASSSPAPSSSGETAAAAAGAGAPSDFVRGLAPAATFARKDALSVFVSSSFSDTSADRTRLHAGAFRRLADKARAIGLLLEFVDLRWGISERAFDERQTVDICLTEVRRCAEQSLGTFFLLLLTDKHGSPLPAASIPAATWDVLLAAADDEQARLLRRMYLCDSNAQPPAYVLIPSSQVDDRDEDWATAGVLSDLATAAAASLSPATVRGFVHSVTELEVETALTCAPEAGPRCVVTNRNFVGLTDAVHDKPLFAVLGPDGRPDPAFQQRQQALRERTTDEFLASMPSPPLDWLGSDVGLTPETNETHKLYLDQLDEFVYSTFAGQIDELVARVIQERSALPAVVAEITTHLVEAQARARGFVGRSAELERLAAHLSSTDAAPPLVVAAPSGCGKTSLLSRAALDLTARLRKASGVKSIVMFRMLGTTKDSSSLPLLLRSLIQQLRGCQPDKTHTPDDLAPLSISGLIDVFRSAVKAAIGDGFTIYLILDSLDQLDDSHELLWLPTGIASANTVVSVIAGSTPDNSLAGVFGENAPRIAMQGFGPDELETALASHLRGRTLTDEQRVFALRGLTSNPHPLLLRLTAEEARGWKSTDAVADLAEPKATVEEAVQALFARIERAHGELLVRELCRLIVLSRDGLAEPEIVDLLSCHEQVMHEIVDEQKRKYGHALPHRRLPPIVVKRLLNDLGDFLVEKRGALNFFHRFLRDGARKRYAGHDNDRDQYAHRLLAEYFGEAAGSSGRAELLTPQPAYLPSAGREHNDFVALQPNERRARELGHAVMALGDADLFESSLCQVEALEALFATESGPRDAALWFSEAVRTFGRDRPRTSQMFDLLVDVGGEVQFGGDQIRSAAVLRGIVAPKPGDLVPLTANARPKRGRRTLRIDGENGAPMLTANGERVFVGPGYHGRSLGTTLFDLDSGLALREYPFAHSPICVSPTGHLADLESGRLTVYDGEVILFSLAVPVLDNMRPEEWSGCGQFCLTGSDVALVVGGNKTVIGRGAKPVGGMALIRARKVVWSRPTPVKHVAISGDEACVAAALAYGVVQLLSMETGDVLHKIVVPAVDDLITSVLWGGPTATTLTVLSFSGGPKDKGLSVWETGGGGRPQLLHEGLARGLGRWMPLAGGMYFVTAHLAHLYVVDATTWKTVGSLDVNEERTSYSQPLHLAVSCDGTSVMVTSDGKFAVMVSVEDPRAPRITRRITGYSGRFVGLQFHPTRPGFALLATTEGVHLVDVNEADEPSEAGNAGAKNVEICIAVSEHNAIYCLSKDRTVAELTGWRPDGEPAGRLVLADDLSTFYAKGLVLAPNRSLVVALVGEKAFVADVSPAGVGTKAAVALRKSKDDQWVACVAWTPCSKFVVGGGQAGGVHAWDAASGDLLWRFAATRSTSQAVAAVSFDDGDLGVLVGDFGGTVTFMMVNATAVKADSVPGWEMERGGKDLRVLPTTKVDLVSVGGVLFGCACDSYFGELMRVWDTSSGKLLLEAPKVGAFAVVGSLLIGLGNAQSSKEPTTDVVVQVWNFTQDGEVAHVMAIPTPGLLVDARNLYALDGAFCDDDVSARLEIASARKNGIVEVRTVRIVYGEDSSRVEGTVTAVRPIADAVRRCIAWSRPIMAVVPMGTRDLVVFEEYQEEK